MAFSNTEIVDKVYKATLFRAPSEDESSYWADQLDQQLYTGVTLTLLGASQDVFMQRNLPVANLFYGIYGRLMAQDEMLFWGRILDQGASTEQVVEAFLVSNEFAQTYAGVSGLDAFKAIYARLWGGEIPSVLLDTYLEQLANEEMSISQVLLDIGSLPPKSLAVALGLVSASLNGVVPEFTEMDTLAAKQGALSDLFGVVNEPEVVEPVEPIEEINGQLALSLSATESIVVDLEKDSLMVDGTAKALTAGNLANLYYLDARDQKTVSVSIQGSSAGEIYFASAQGDSIRLKGGNDQITLNAGTDSLIFEYSASTNGLDSISNFNIGSGGDTLDFNAFLNAANTGNLATQDATSTAAQTWNNGDVLVVSGNGLDSATAIAGLFGAAKTFAAPLGAAKAVIISADIVGDASVWYLTNQTDTGVIASEEITQVATLAGINNLGLVGFDAANFVA
ncbi:hypothetical protein D5125_05590 [Magnetovirga frankeli]|uniref:hypothetical protein n=1 Tax=Magnetovirga frankeli TaxID=947516 RepID=UPI001292E539|nr:hypothetical protein D5125_05590 [gamma proteobacterium SS-5]